MISLEFEGLTFSRGKEASEREKYFKYINTTYFSQCNHQIQDFVFHLLSLLAASQDN